MTDPFPEDTTTVRLYGMIAGISYTWVCPDCETPNAGTRSDLPATDPHVDIPCSGCQRRVRIGIEANVQFSPEEGK